MPERAAALADQLKRVQTDLDKAAHAFNVSVEEFGEVLGSRDLPRINAARESMQMASERMRLLTDEERALQSRLDHVAATELTRAAAKAARAASRAAWATFWAAVFTVIAAATVTITLVLATGGR